MTIECGGVRADKGQVRSFQHTDGRDLYKIKLTGYEKGGRVFWQHYLIHESSLPRSFGEFLASPFTEIRHVDESYIYSEGLDVKAGEETEISSSGLFAKGS